MTKDVQDLCTENYKTLLREIKEDLNKLRNIIGRFNIVKI